MDRVREPRRARFGSPSIMKTRAFGFSVCLIVLAMGAAVGTVHAEGQTVAANEVAEVKLVSGKEYKDPFNEAELTARVTRPDRTTFEVPGFWDGGGQVGLSVCGGAGGELPVADAVYGHGEWWTERGGREDRGDGLCRG